MKSDSAPKHIIEFFLKFTPLLLKIAFQVEDDFYLKTKDSSVRHYMVCHIKPESNEDQTICHFLVIYRKAKDML